MDPQLKMIKNGINNLVVKIFEGTYNPSDVANLRIYIDGYNHRVGWLANKHSPEVHSYIKSEDFGIYIAKDVIYIKF